MVAESNVREEYILQEDEDGCTAVAVQSFAAAWNMVETKQMNGELIFTV